MFNVYFWSVIMFFGALAIVIYRDRKNLEFHKILVIKRTDRGKKLLNNVASWNPGFWNVLSTLFVIVAFAFMLYGMYILSLSTYFVVKRVITRPAIQLILPVAQSQPINGVGFIGVPFWFWILAFPFVLIPHEFAHGVISRANKVRIENVGLIQLLIFSGAFVEPNEKDLKKSNLITKLRIFAAGSVSNVVVALLIFMLTQYALWPMFVTDGIMLGNVIEGGAAADAGLKSGMFVQEINGERVDVKYTEFIIGYTYLLANSENMTSENIRVLPTRLSVARILRDFEPGQTVEVVADDKSYVMTFSERPDNSTLPYMGIVASGIAGNEFMLEFLFPLIWWMTNISIFVAIFNLLPLYPLDGGLMVEAVAERWNKKYSKIIVKTITSIIVAILLMNFIGPVLIKTFL